MPFGWKRSERLHVVLLDDLPATELGAQVRKGEKGTTAFYAGTITVKTDEEPDNIEDEEARQRRFMKAYAVFNADQIKGLSDEYFPKAKPTKPSAERSDDAERYFAATGSDIRHGGNKAFYAYGGAVDYIRMPPFESFADPKNITAPSRTSISTGGKYRAGWTAILAAKNGAMKHTPLRSLLQISALPFSVSRWGFIRIIWTTMPPIFKAG